MTFLKYMTIIFYLEFDAVILAFGISLVAKIPFYDCIIGVMTGMLMLALFVYFITFLIT